VKDHYFLARLCKGKGKGKGKVHPRTGNENPEGKKRYSSALPLTPALDGGWVRLCKPNKLSG